MSAKVTLFSQKQFQPFGYFFYVVTWNDHEEGIEKALDQFGVRLGLKGMVVQAHKESRYEVATEILNMQWPKELRKAMRKSPIPFLIVLQKEIPDFNIEKDRWAVIWLDEKINKVQDILHQVALTVKEKGDVFELLEEAYRRQKKKGIKEAVKSLTPTLKWGAGIAISAAKLFI